MAVLKSKAPLDATGTPVDPAKTYAAIDAFVSTEYAVSRGARLTGASPQVQKHAAFFTLDPVADDEAQRLRAKMQREHEAQHEVAVPALIAPPAPLPPDDADLMLCVRATQPGRGLRERIFTSGDQLGAAVGDRLLATSKLVRANPECFVPIATPGVDRSRAVICPVRLEHGDAEGVRVVEAGTWVDEGDPILRTHPDLDWRRPPVRPAA